MSARESVLVLDFGSQYSQLIARRIREQGVYCEIVPHDITPAQVAKAAPKALVLSGGPASVCEPNSPRADAGLFAMGLPVLGICYGMQLLGQLLGGEVSRGRGREYGPATLSVDQPGGLFDGLDSQLNVWMSHGDYVSRPPAGFVPLAHTGDCALAAMGDLKRKIYGVQFHPEVVHTPRGTEILRNFLFRAAGCAGGWTMSNFIEQQIREIRATVGTDHVICALSGGVDSSVVAALLSKAIGEQMHAIFVDNGLLRQDERAQVERYFRHDYPLNLSIVDASEQFLSELAGVSEPEKKRKIIGKTFIDVFTAEATKYQNARFLAQGTLYPDVIESRSAKGGPSVTIKTHHNVGGLPEKLNFKLIEPLKELFKDEVRRLGLELGLPEQLIQRQPFPGPGLAVRILGDVNRADLEVLQKADAIVRQEIAAWEGNKSLWQWFAVLLPVKTVGVMGDERTYAEVVAIRAITSQDGMTADWAKLPHDLLGRMSARIINEVRGVNRVVYDISSKPPSTIEWE